ncbi:hypothetical protein X975_10557, partial [Stegodyphus mimosarum]
MQEAGISFNLSKLHQSLNLKSSCQKRIAYFMAYIEQVRGVIFLFTYL